MELLERQAELDTLARQLRDSGANAGKLTFVCGEAGIGKSHLLGRLGAWAEGGAANFVLHIADRMKAEGTQAN